MERGTSRKEYFKWVDDPKILKKYESRDWWYTDRYEWSSCPYRNDYKCWKRYRKVQYRSK